MTATPQKRHIHVTAALIEKNGKLLITKRAKGSHLEGLWEFPGGKQEQGETLRGCLEREIQEELGFRISADLPLLTVVHEYEDKVVCLHVFHCSVLAGDPKALGCQTFQWVFPEEMCTFDFPPPDIKVIEFLKKEKVSFK